MKLEAKADRQSIGKSGSNYRTKPEEEIEKTIEKKLQARPEDKLDYKNKQNFNVRQIKHTKASMPKEEAIEIERPQIMETKP